MKNGKEKGNEKVSKTNINKLVKMSQRLTVNMRHKKDQSETSDRKNHLLNLV